MFARTVTGPFFASVFVSTAVVAALSGIAGAGCAKTIDATLLESCETAPACNGGGSYRVCTAKDMTGTCAGISYRVTGGSSFACASCSDCVNAEKAAVKACATPGTSTPNPFAGDGGGVQGEANERCTTSGPCGTGPAIQVCTVSRADGACASKRYQAAGASFACASCTDCSSAAQRATAACQGGTSSGGTSTGGTSTGGTSSGGASSGGTSSGGTSGGSGNCVGMVDTGSPACTTCLENGCCAELGGCFNDARCTALVNCLGACAPNDTVCSQSCAQQYPSSIGLVNALSQCIQTTCGTECQ